MSTIIQFKDINVKEALLASSDVNPDGTREISYAEAENSSLTGAQFKTAINPNENNTNIVSFEELPYFKNLKLVTFTFRGCSNLKNIKVTPGLINSTYYGLFYDCAIEVLHLEDFTYLKCGHSNITNGNTKFGRLSSLKEIWIPNLELSEGNAFISSHVPNLEKIIVSSGEQWVSYRTTGNLDTRPSVSGKASLYSINDLEHPITSLSTLSQAVPGVTTQPTVYAFTFAELKNLTDITISAPNTVVEAGAFKDLPNTVTIHNFNYIVSTSNKIMGNNAFENCKALGIETFPSGIQVVSDRGFYNSSLTEIDSDNLLTINGYYSFSKSPLTSVKINGCTSVSNAINSFSDCKSLQYFSANSLQVITSGMFAGDTALTTVSITSAIEIKDSAFVNCSQLSTIDATNVVTFGSEAFKGCSNLSNTGFNLSNAQFIGARCFNGCTNMVCPSDFQYLSSIGDSAFQGGKCPTERYVIFRYQGIVNFMPSDIQALRYAINTFGTRNGQGITTIYVPYGNLTIEGVTKSYVQWYQEDTHWSQFISINNITIVSLDINGNVPT